MRSLLADKEESTSWINHLNGLPEQNIAITELKNKYAERIARINALVTRSTGKIDRYSIRYIGDNEY
jgi:hypothetical protein